MEWKVFLTGDEFDLDALSKSFSGPDPAVVREDEGFVLRSSRFSQFDDSDAVRADAEYLLMLLNGAARLALHARRPIVIRDVVLIQNDGAKVYYKSVADTIYIRATASATLKRGDGVEEQFNEANVVSEWVNAGLGSEAVARVLGLFATKPVDWVNLYRILEVVEGDVGGPKSIADQGWATREALKRFKHTANSVFASGDDARHGTERTQPPADPMTLSEARSFIEAIVHNWLRTKENP